MVQFLKNYYRNHSVKLLISLLFFLMALFTFAAITNEVLFEKEEQIDLMIFEFFKAHIIRPGRTGFMYTITQFSSAPFVKIAYPFLMLALLTGRFYRRALFTVAAGGGGLMLIYITKLFFARPRPLHPLLYREESFSFPSGHATFSFIFYGMLAYFIWLTDLPKIWKYVFMIFLVILSLAIGFSRIYLRVHYPSDVLGGFSLGYFWIFLMIYTFRRWFPLA